MSVARITEISATSTDSFEGAIKEGIARAAETLRGIHGAWVKEQNVTIENNQITAYRVNLLVTFLLEE
ncbi:MAG: dodecin family protein [Vulcanimicrobiaceae bacterium]